MIEQVSKAKALPNIESINYNEEIVIENILSSNPKLKSIATYRKTEFRQSAVYQLVAFELESEKGRRCGKINS